MLYVVGFGVVMLVVSMIAVKLYPHKITIVEVGIGLVVQCIVLAVICYGSIYQSGKDTEIWNGMVLSKKRVTVSCEHSYQCNCRTVSSGSGANRTTTTTCDTCYEHTHDYDWRVNSSVGNFNIARVDSQGSREPKRFTDVKISEPVSVEKNYFNPIKAVPFSLFNRDMIDNDTKVPEYPEVYDYHRINRVISFETSFSDGDKLNNLLNDRLRDLGEKKKINIVVILHEKDDSFAEIVKAKSLGGKINDITVLIGLEKDLIKSLGVEKISIKNVSTFSWSKSDLVNVKIRDDILDIGNFDSEKIANAITSNIENHYVHRPIAEFDYLNSETTMPAWGIVLAVIFGLVFPFVWGYIAHRFEIA